MLELFTVLVRYVVVAYGLNLAVSPDVVDALAGAAVTGFTILWMLFDKGYFSKIKKLVVNWFKR